MTAKRLGRLAVLCSIALAGCSGSSKSDGGSPDAGAPAQACATDTDCAGGALCAARACHAFAPEIVAPVEDALVPAQFDVTVQANGDIAPDAVTLAIDGHDLLPPMPADSARIDATAARDGRHTMVARVSFGARSWYSPTRNFVLDRTPPSITWTPSPGTVSLRGLDHLEGAVSEPLDPTSIEASSLIVQADGVPLTVTVELAADARAFTVRFPSALGAVGQLTVGWSLPPRDVAGNSALYPYGYWSAPTPSVQLLAPAADLATAGTVAFEVAATGDFDSLTLEATKDWSQPAVTLATFTAPPYTFAWDTSTVAEGTWRVQAVARRASTNPYYPSPWSSVQRSITVDRTAPTLASCLPLASTRANLDVGESLLATFSEDVDPASLGAVALTINGGAARAVVTAYDAAYRRLTVTPMDEVATPAVEILALTGVKDRAGNALAADPCTFMLPAWQFPSGTAGAASSYGIPFSAAPALAVGWGGPSASPAQRVLPVVAWPSSYAWGTVGVNGWSPPLPSASYYYSSGWMDLAASYINDPNTKSSADPQLAMTPTGDPVVAFTDLFNDGVQQVLVKRSVAAPNGYTSFTWSAYGGPLNRNAARVASEPALALDGAGRPVVAWIEERGGALDPALYVSRWDGTWWSEVGGAVNATFTGRPSAPTVAVDSAGTLHVAWLQPDGGGGQRVRVARWNGASSAWQPLGGTLDATGSTSTPALAADAHVFVAFSEKVASLETALVQRWNGTDAWEALGAGVHADAAQPSRTPSLRVRSGDAPVVAFVESDGTADQLYVSTWDAQGAAWTVAGGPLNANALHSARLPTLALDADGVAAVAWLEGTDLLLVARENR